MVILKMEQHEHRHRDMKEPAVFQEPWEFEEEEFERKAGTRMEIVIAN